MHTRISKWVTIGSRKATTRDDLVYPRARTDKYTAEGLSEEDIIDSRIREGYKSVTFKH